MINMNHRNSASTIISECVKHKGWNNCPFCGRELIIKYDNLICSNYKSNYHIYKVNINASPYFYGSSMAINFESLEIKGVIITRNAYSVNIEIKTKPHEKSYLTLGVNDLIISSDLSLNKIKKLVLLQ